MTVIGDFSTTTGRRLPKRFFDTCEQIRQCGIPTPPIVTAHGYDRLQVHPSHIHLLSKPFVYGEQGHFQPHRFLQVKRQSVDDGAGRRFVELYCELDWRQRP
jgi:hypothetical protein